MNSKMMTPFELARWRARRILELSAPGARAVKAANLPTLRRMMVSQRAKGRGGFIDTATHLMPGIKLRDRSLMLLLGNEPIESGREKRRLRKIEKPLWPLFTMWQETRLVLLKKPKKTRWIRRPL